MQNSSLWNIRWDGMGMGESIQIYFEKNESYTDALYRKIHIFRWRHFEYRTSMNNTREVFLTTSPTRSNVMRTSHHITFLECIPVNVNLHYGVEHVKMKLKEMRKKIRTFG